MNESEQKAVDVLRELGYLMYKGGILYAKARADQSQIEFIPWERIRRFDVTPQSATVRIVLWNLHQSENIDIRFESSQESNAVYKFLSSKFRDSINSRQ